MRDAWMQVLPPTTSTSTHPHSRSFASGPPGSRAAGTWTREENKLFENALAHFEGDGPDRWLRVAQAIPGKTACQVLAHYRALEADVTQIEAGLVPVPVPVPGPFYFSDRPLPARHFAQESWSAAKAAAAAAADHERKKGVPWTQEEHRLFLLGLKKHGKGDWRSISRNFVLTRTPTQVASHAQKYFIRQNSGNRDKRRPSIHDITTSNLPDATSPLLHSPSSPSSIFAPVNSKPSIY